MIKWKIADLFRDCWANGHTVVIPTNVGWTKDGRNVMGRGLAKEADEYARDNGCDLSLLYGASCRLGMPRIYLAPWDMILVPTKPLGAMPHLSWRGMADLKTVEESLRWLQAYAEVFKQPVCVPLLGAGNGRLDPGDVEDLMERILVDRKFIGVTRPK